MEFISPAEPPARTCYPRPLGGDLGGRWEGGGGEWGAAEKHLLFHGPQPSEPPVLWSGVWLLRKYRISDPVLVRADRHLS